MIKFKMKIEILLVLYSSHLHLSEGSLKLATAIVQQLLSYSDNIGPLSEMRPVLLQLNTTKYSKNFLRENECSSPLKIFRRDLLRRCVLVDP